MRGQMELSRLKTRVSLLLAFVLPTIVAATLVFLNFRTPLSILHVLRDLNLFALLLVVWGSVLAGYVTTFFVLRRLLGSAQKSLSICLMALVLLAAYAGSRQRNASIETKDLVDQVEKKNRELKDRVVLGQLTFELSCFHAGLSGPVSDGYERAKFRIPIDVRVPGDYLVEFLYSSESNPKKKNTRLVESMKLQRGGSAAAFDLSFGRMWGVFRKQPRSEVTVAVFLKASGQDIYGQGVNSRAQKIFSGTAGVELVGKEPKRQLVTQRTFQIDVASLPVRAIDRLVCPD